MFIAASSTISPLFGYSAIGRISPSEYTPKLFVAEIELFDEIIESFVIDVIPYAFKSIDFIP